MDKQTLFNKRTEFFNEILKHIDSPPSKMDEILKQDSYYIKPFLEECFINAPLGDMAISIHGSFFEKSFKIFYSLWQVGDSLRIGIALDEPELQGAFALDRHDEAKTLWSDVEPKIDIARGCVFYDWEFFVPNLYNSYKEQEKFILGIKHMHFRTMRIISDECRRIYLNRLEESSTDFEIDYSNDDDFLILRDNILD